MSGTRPRRHPRTTSTACPTSRALGRFATSGFVSESRCDDGPRALASADRARRRRGDRARRRHGRACNVPPGDRARRPRAPGGGCRDRETCASGAARTRGGRLARTRHLPPPGGAGRTRRADRLLGLDARAPSRLRRRFARGRPRRGRGALPAARSLEPPVGERAHPGLPHPDEAADHVPPAPDCRRRPLRGRQGGSLGRAPRGDARRTGARLRRRVRPQPRARPGHRPAHAANGPKTGRGRSCPTRTCARVRAGALGVLLRRPRELRERARRAPRRLREPVLRPGVHPLAEAVDAAEHRHRRCSRGRAAGGRLGGRNRESDAAGPLALSHRLRLDAAALLGAGDPHPA